ncbi:MAG: PEP-CTERM sorting domain-containing protein [Pseudomonadales bacterium]|nr:PEP-CTERM sorting domain-containing protein [Pseudomonadales bacterium]
MKLKTTALLIGSVFAATANASSFLITVENDWPTVPDGDAQTAPIDQLTFGKTLATSFYDGLAPGANVVDTNIQFEMNALDFDVNATQAIDGSAISFRYPTKNDDVDVDSMSIVPSANAADTEGFNQIGTGWSMSYQFKLIGTLQADGVEYYDGFIDIFYNSTVDLNNAQFETQVARINIDDSDLDQGNLYISGAMSFDFDGDGTDDANDGVDLAADAFVQNFFTDVNMGKNYYDIWTEGGDTSISFLLDTNIDPPTPQAYDTAVTFGPNGAPSGFVRQSELDGSVRFNVPEPGSLVLIGAGLLGLGMSSRKRKA